MTGDPSGAAAKTMKTKGRAAKKAPSSKASSKRPAAKKTTGKARAKAAKKAPAKKAPAKKPPAKKKPSKKGAAKKTLAKKAPVRKAKPAARKKAPAKAKPPPPGRDLLTGLPNSDRIRDAARKSFADAAQGGQAVTLAVIDVDDFREINDVFEPQIADAFLAAISERLAAALGPSEDLLGRLSGDLFLLILMGVEPEEAFLKLEKVRGEIAAREIKVGRGKNQRRSQCSVSIGLAGFPKDGRLDDQVLARSLAALRRAKRLGKNRVGLPPDDAMTTKTSHYTRTQLDALRRLAKEQGRNDAGLLREALEDILLKYKGRRPEEA